MDPTSSEAHGWSILQKLNEQKSMGLFCDVSLMVEGKIFLAHKNVLSACSEYFYAALSRNEQQQFLVLDNVSLEGFSHLLDFIYTYKIPTCHVQDFMQAAQLLQVSLPLTVQVVSVPSSPRNSSPKEEICIPDDDDYRMPTQDSELRDAESQPKRERSRQDNLQSISNSLYKGERRRLETMTQIKDNAKVHKRPTFYKETYVVRKPGYLMRTQLSKSGRLGRESPVDDCIDNSFINTGYSRQVPITIHNDGSSEEADDEAADICIDLCDEPDTPDSLEPVKNLRLRGESLKPKIFSTVVGLENSNVMERVNGSENLSEVVHKCERCELLLTYREFLNHQDDPGVNILQCSFCEQQFNYSCQLSLHQSSHHDKKFYQCDQCGKELTTLKKLHDHIAYHSDARPHKCQLCDKAYKVKNDLTQHIRTKHIEASTGKPPLLQLCEFCGQAVKHYKSHKIFCSGVKKFKCDFCVQSFHRISELKRHTWTHTGELPYRCKICGKGCRHPSNMKKHIRTVHKADMRVQINREHASPRFFKNRRPAAKFSGHVLPQVLPSNHSLPVPASTGDHNIQTDSSVSPVSLSYISIFTGDETATSDFSLRDSQNTSPQTARS
ncbi:myoneurin-like isoform X1 [Bufo gargarizans]|uniref:myoneurin-like isoform X1 n=1 Tax=Bufo gargarizans TaxID=30331 RepID=UPI001CF518B6|nr:myoneurin-like isoform X1 [Bufo gargarizans]XP_044126810.1 myoneurin-like isoform X1 [Bufo gargarizans]XP_044126819.1 myoneurin-like isoform X1 [Bufo gargarizans]